jgi:hypothetical protein
MSSHLISAALAEDEYLKELGNFKDTVANTDPTFVTVDLKLMNVAKCVFPPRTNYCKVPLHGDEFKWKHKSAMFICFMPCVLSLNEHHAMKAYWGSGGIAPFILSPRH